MGRYFPKINLRPDLPPGSEVDKPHAARRKGYILLVVGLVLVVAALFLHFSGKNNKESPQILVKVGTAKPQEKKVAPPPSPEPQAPQEEKESPPPPPPPSPEKTAPEKTLEVRLPQPTEKAPLQEKTASKIQLPSSNLPQEESPQPVKKREEEVTRLQITLFPGLHPVKVKNTLAGEGIKFKEENREVTTTLWRVMVETSPSSSDKDRQKLKELTGSTPWRLKKGKKLYLVVSSLKEKEPSQDLAKELESKGFKAQVAPITKKVNLKVVVFPIQEKEWEKVRTTLERLGAQVVEARLLDRKASLSQPTLTTSHGKGSASPLPR